ncbi:MAG: HAD family phosphatase [Gemmatimonadota bacterium]|jgi:putative hydrolase of the HAD superfamily
MADSRITALFLDVGGVLLTNGWDRRARAAAAERFDLDVDEMDERHHLTFDTYEEGKLTLDQYLERVVFHTERSFSPQAFREFMFAQSEADEEMLQLVRGLKERHALRLVAVSNEGRELTEHRIRMFELDRLFDCFVASCFVHFRKPDADMYRLALDVAQVPAEHALYIDDRLMFVQVARSLGLHALHHTDLEGTRSALAAYDLTL